MNLELKTAAVHKSFSGNVTLAMFLSSHGDGFGADYEVPLVHESFSANAGSVFFFNHGDRFWHELSSTTFRRIRAKYWPRKPIQHCS